MSATPAPSGPAAPDNTVPHDPRVLAFWREFCSAAGVPAATPFQAWYFGDSDALAHELAELVLHGPKRATAAAAWSVDRNPATGAVPWGYSVVTERDGTPRAVIRTTSLERRALDAVDAQFAWDEGEGDRTLADWLAAHRAYFGRECAAYDVPFTEDMPVILERFELLYPFERALAVPDGPRLVPGYLPGAIGAIAALHAEYYAHEHGFGAPFEAKVAASLSEFLMRFDPARDGLWLVVDAGRILGSVAIDGSDPTADTGSAHLRWFLLAPALHGRGLGRRLLDAALAFSAHAGHRRVWLDTFAGLDAARRLYERAGFRLVREADAASWGRTVREQRFERRDAGCAGPR